MDSSNDAHIRGGSMRRRRRRRGRGRRARVLGSNTLLLVGNLKVGKSAIFDYFSGRHRDFVKPGPGPFELPVTRIGTDRFDFLVDTPGIYSLQERSENARLIRNLLINRNLGGLLLVLDAKNLKRGMSLALELAEFEVPMVVALNMCDEARQRGVEVDVKTLAKLLGVPVIPTVATENRGLNQLKRAIDQAGELNAGVEYPEWLQRVAEKIAAELEGHSLPTRGLAYLLASSVIGVKDIPSTVDTSQKAAIESRLSGLDSEMLSTSDILLAEATRTRSAELFDDVISTRQSRKTTFLDRLGVWSRKPSSGIPIAAVVLVIVYLFVGWLGATIMVDFLEGTLFGDMVLPVIEKWVSHIPVEWIREMLTGQFGLVTVGITLSLAIVLPVLATFFFAFALLEDSGYLPRLSLLLDRLMRRIGLNGKGVLPIIMGLSCVTMAILTTRMLDSKKQRIIATLLLILSMPCAPLLAVMMVLLARLSIWATVVLFGILIGQFLVIGFLANLLIPGERPDFVLELPPMRAPRMKNSLIKSGHQLIWFMKEAIPYFLLGTFILFLLDQAGSLDALRSVFLPISEKVLGLPGESADVFLMTMVRREAGAALLSQQAAGGIYDGVQVVVTLIVMTTIIPCINSVLVMFKERGFWISLGMLLFVIVYSILIGGLVNAGCHWLGLTF